MSGMTVTAFLAEKIQKLKIAVVGDIMLDRYFHGEVKRISPEAPVPVTKITKIKSVLGGAANVANNLAQLECKVFMGGVTGDDDNRILLDRLMQAAGIDNSGLIKSDVRKTITKLRVLGGQQQMLRMDFEEVGDLYAEEVTAIKDWLSKLLKEGLDGIVLSDYAKGVCTPELCQWVINAGKEYNIPVLVDPKGADWSKYTNCDYITPNLKEMCDAAGCEKENEDNAVVEMAKFAKNKYGIKNIIVTRSERGMTVVNDEEIIHSPATAREVFDVSGAGDTVAATLLCGVAGKLSIKETVYMANRAAGIVVGHVGTYPIHHEELLKDLIQEEKQQTKIYRPLTWEEAQSLAATWKAAGEKVVFTNGCFDILHVGHVTYLEKAKNLGKHLILGLNTDASVRRLKGETRPLVSELARARVLAALSSIDAVVLFDQDTPTELIKRIRPDILVKGGDYKPEQVAGREYAGEVQIIDFEDGYSTTGVVEKIAKMAKEGKL